MLGAFLATGGWILLALTIIISLALDLVGLFGNWILLLAFVITWVATSFQHVGWVGMGGMLLLALLGEGLEFLMAGFGAKKFGGSRGSMGAALVGALVGAVVGTPWFPVLGTLAGACLGAFSGAALYEYLQMEKSAGSAMKTGLGAALGRIGGIAAKFTCGIGILLVAFLTW